MSQFMLCKSRHDLIEQKCVRAVDCKENKEFFVKVIKELFGDVSDDIWVVTNIDFVFTQTQKQNGICLFKNTELCSLLSMLYDVSEVLILWYGSEYQDLDYVKKKEQFLNIVEENIADSMCECYVYVKK